jgi:hypothetical protein
LRDFVAEPNPWRVKGKRHQGIEISRLENAGLLAVVVKLAELFRVKAEFACHLDFVSCESRWRLRAVDPELESVRCSSE